MLDIDLRTIHTMKFTNHADSCQPGSPNIIKVIGGPLSSQYHRISSDKDICYILIIQGMWIFTIVLKANLKLCWRFLRTSTYKLTLEDQTINLLTTLIRYHILDSTCSVGRWLDSIPEKYGLIKREYYINHTCYFYLNSLNSFNLFTATNIF